MQQCRVCLVVGTRPEAIKLGPVAAALSARGLSPRLVLTGQHADLDPAAHALGGLPATRLSCAGSVNPHAHARSVATALIRAIPPATELIVVQGDTSSAYGGALAGFWLGLPVAHVEAGLRSHDRALPWPEEEYRVAIDMRADLLFAPTELAATNLRREGVPGSIVVTGNTGVDALLKVKADLPPVRLADGGLPRLLVTCHRRENWGAPLHALAIALRRLAEGGEARIDILLPPNRHVAGEMRSLLGGVGGIALLPPCTHRELVAMMQACDLMLSDSGGVQEEAPTLGVPLLVLRDKTERPEAIATGNMQLVGMRTRTILTAVRRLLDDPVERAAMARPCFPYGDGRAGERIAAQVADWLASRNAADFPEPARRSA